MSTYLALTFGTLLSSQGTDASFEPLSQALRASFFRVSSLADDFRFAFHSVFPAGLRPDGPSDVSNLSRSPLRKANPTAIQLNAHSNSGQGMPKA